MDLGDSYRSFDALDSIGKASLILGNELWEENLALCLGLVKEFIIDILEECKTKLYGNSQYTQQPRLESSAGDLGDVAGIVGGQASVCAREISLTQVKCNCVCLCGSALENGCMVNGYGCMLSISIITRQCVRKITRMAAYTKLSVYRVQSFRVLRPGI